MAQVSTNFRIIFLLFNLLYCALGVGMLAVGIFFIVNLDQYGFFTQNSYTPGAGIFIGVGALKMVFGLVGIIGMFGKWKRLLVLYAFSLIFLMGFTFVAGIYAFHRRPDVYDITMGRLTEAFSSTDNYMQYSEDIFTVQENLDCCGVREGTADYAGIIPVLENCTAAAARARVNVTVFDTTSPRQVNAFTELEEGCLRYFTQEIQFNLYYIGAIGIAFGTFDLTALLVGMQNLEGI